MGSTSVSRADSMQLKQLVRVATEPHGGGEVTKEQYFVLPENALRSKGAVEKLFKDIYVAAMKQMMGRKLAVGGIAWLEKVFATFSADGARWDDLSVTRVYEQFRSGFDEVPDSVWYETLPSLVRLSWFLTESIEMRHHHPLRNRLERPHYYVPLGPNEQLFYPLFALALAIQGVRQRRKSGNVKGPNPSWIRGGWLYVEFPQDSRQGAIPQSPECMLLLPVVAQSLADTVRRPFLPRSEAQPPTLLARRPGTATGVLLLRPGATQPKPNAHRMGISTAFGDRVQSYVELNYADLLDIESFVDTLNERRLALERTM